MEYKTYTRFGGRFQRPYPPRQFGYWFGGPNPAARFPTRPVFEPRRNSSTPTPKIWNSSTPTPKIFVGGISWDSTAESLHWYFSQFGNIAMVEIPPNPHHPYPWLMNRFYRHRGFGFITFYDEESVFRALSKSIHIVDGRLVDVKSAYAFSTNPNLYAGIKYRKVFVGGITMTTRREDLYIYFSNFGRVETVLLPVDPFTRIHRGFAFVTFQDVDAVDRACQTRFHFIDCKRIEVKTALPRRPITAPIGAPIGAAIPEPPPPNSNVDLSLGLGLSGSSSIWNPMFSSTRNTTDASSSSSLLNNGSVSNDGLFPDVSGNAWPKAKTPESAAQLKSPSSGSPVYNLDQLSWTFGEGFKIQE